MHLKNKGLTQSRNPEVQSFMDRFSKMALADLVIQLVRQQAPEASLDGEDLADRVNTYFRTLAEERGDTPPKWKPVFRARKVVPPSNQRGSLKLLDAVPIGWHVTVIMAMAILGEDAVQAQLAIDGLVKFHRVELVGSNPSCWQRVT